MNSTAVHCTEYIKENELKKYLLDQQGLIQR